MRCRELQKIGDSGRKYDMEPLSAEGFDRNVVAEVFQISMDEVRKIVQDAKRTIPQQEPT
jgi:hypothetical protein